MCRASRSRGRMGDERCAGDGFASGEESAREGGGGGGSESSAEWGEGRSTAAGVHEIMTSRQSAVDNNHAAVKAQGVPEPRTSVSGNTRRSWPGSWQRVAALAARVSSFFAPPWAVEPEARAGAAAGAGLCICAVCCVLDRTSLISPSNPPNHAGLIGPGRPIIGPSASVVMGPGPPLSSAAHC